MRLSHAIATGILALALMVGLVVAVPNEGRADEALPSNEDAELLAVEPKTSDVAYIDEHCDQKVAEDCLALDEKTTEIKTGWYVLLDNVTLDKPLVVEGDVCLILTGEHQLSAKQGIRVKKDATLTVYTQTDASASMLVRKGIVRELTEEQKEEEAQRIARMREIDPLYKEEEPQLLFVWPCLEVTAGDVEPSTDPEHVFDPEHDPKPIEKPELKQELLKKDYLVITPRFDHDLVQEEGSFLVEDGHVVCKRCDGWFEDLECHEPAAKPDKNGEADSSAEEATAQAEANESTADGEAETITITFDANGGSGSMDPVQVKKGDSFILPECAYQAPSGMEFSQWSLGKPGATVSVPSDITVRAWWKQSSTSDGNQQQSSQGSGAQSTTNTTKGDTQSSTQNNASTSSANNSASPDTSDPTTRLSDIAGVLIVCGLVLVFFGKMRLMLD